MCLWLSHVHHLSDFVSIPLMLPKLLWMFTTWSGDLCGCPAADLVMVWWVSVYIVTVMDAGEVSPLISSPVCVPKNSHLWSSDSGEFVMSPVRLIQREDTVWHDRSMHLPFPYAQRYPMTAMADGPSLPCLWIIRHVSYLIHKVCLWLKLVKNLNLRVKICLKLQYVVSKVSKEDIKWNLTVILTIPLTDESM